MTAETEERRRKREERRALFDSVAGLYDCTRQGYPAEIVDAVFTTATIGPGAAVLEIGCGTGQLTRQLADRALKVTAIDIGAAMAEAARRNLADAMTRFQVCSFEDWTNPVRGMTALALAGEHLIENVGCNAVCDAALDGSRR